MDGLLIFFSAFELYYSLFLRISRFSEVEFTYTLPKACKRPSLEVGQLSEAPAHSEEGYSPCLKQENEASSHGQQLNRRKNLARGRPH